MNRSDRITSLRETIGRRDAEIERLTAALAAIDDHGRASSFVEALRAKDAEIERLKEQNEITVSVCNENTDLKKLITELCDALEEECSAQDYQDLVTRAREATNGR